MLRHLNQSLQSFPVEKGVEISVELHKYSYFVGRILAECVVKKTHPPELFPNDTKLLCIIIDFGVIDEQLFEEFTLEELLMHIDIESYDEVMWGSLAEKFKFKNKKSFQIKTQDVMFCSKQCLVQKCKLSIYSSLGKTNTSPGNEPKEITEEEYNRMQGISTSIE